MKTVRFVGVGRPPQIEDVPTPAPGPGQVVVKIGGAGVCHSDLHVMEEDLGFKPPFTLGHENAGWVSAVGDGVTGFAEGDAVAVYGPWGCGHCRACQRSMENYCENWAQIDGFGGGLGLDGGMADYMLVPSARLLVPLGGLSPAKAAPLSDAALTPYHAIKRALPYLHPDSTAVVLGVGGLGHMAIQLLGADGGDRDGARRKDSGGDDHVPADGCRRRIREAEGRTDHRARRAGPGVTLGRGPRRRGRNRFDGPFSGGKHEFIVRGDLVLTIPNPHKGDIGPELLAIVRRQAGITRKEWESVQPARCANDRFSATR